MDYLIEREHRAENNPALENITSRQLNRELVCLIFIFNLS